jgi:hypothetical protein
MRNIDPDIAEVLRMLQAGREAKRVGKVRAKNLETARDKIETMIELVGEELEAHIPRTHPMFLPALTAIVIHKVERQCRPEEPVETSPLAEGWNL